MTDAELDELERRLVWGERKEAQEAGESLLAEVRRLRCRHSRGDGDTCHDCGATGMDELNRERERTNAAERLAEAVRAHREMPHPSGNCPECYADGCGLEDPLLEAIDVAYEAWRNAR